MKRRANARPAWINKPSLQNFVWQLVQQIAKWAKFQDLPDQPMENAGNLAAGLFYLEAADGYSTATVLVRIHAKASAYKGTAALSGKFTKDGIVIFLNGALTPNELLSPQRMQSLHDCRHETCLAYGIYSLLLHELTHALEIGNRKITYSSAKVIALGEAAWGPYVNDPYELRAFMQNIVDETIRYAGMPAIRANAVQRENADRRLIEIALGLSTTWRLISPHLYPASKKLLLKAVYDGLVRMHLFFGQEVAT